MQEKPLSSNLATKLSPFLFQDNILIDALLRGNV